MKKDFGRSTSASSDFGSSHTAGVFGTLVKSLGAVAAPRRVPSVKAAESSPMERVVATFGKPKKLSPGTARILDLPADPRAPQQGSKWPAEPRGYRVRVGDREFTEEQVRQVCRHALEARRLRANDATRIETIINRRGQLPKDLLAKLYPPQT